MTITPDIMVNYAKFNVCKTNFEIPISEHRLLFEYIKITMQKQLVIL